MTIEFDQLEPAERDDPTGGARRRRRLVAAVAAAMLVAAAGGAGYGIGRNVDGDATTTAADTQDSATERSETSEAAATPSTAATEPTTPEPMSIEPMSEDGGDTTFAADGDRSIGGFQASGQMGYPAFGTQPMETLYERTTDSGFALEAQLGEIWSGVHGEGDWGVGDWQPAPWCFQSGQLRVSMTGNGVVDVGMVPWYSEPFKGRAVSSMLLGGNDANPQWVVVVQAPADVATVRVIFGDGSTDSAVPQNGIAVVTGPGAAPEPVTEDGYTFWIDAPPSYEVTFEGGSEPVTVTADGAGDWDDPEFRESCTPPPPALPDPGEQPADPSAAEAEIRAAMSTLYGVVGTDDVGTDLIDDPTGVAEAREQVQAGGFADDAADAAVTIDELVFTAPDEAWFRYAIDTPGNDFYDRYGIAVFVDSVWKITRATICQDLSLAGGDCGGDWQPIYPPGAFGDEYPGPPPTVLDGEEFIAPATTVLLDD